MSLATNALAVMLVPMAAFAVVGNEPPVEPVTNTFPDMSMARAVEWSSVGPPKLVPNTILPAGSYLLT